MSFKQTVDQMVQDVLDMGSPKALAQDSVDSMNEIAAPFVVEYYLCVIDS